MAKQLHHYVSSEGGRIAQAHGGELPQSTSASTPLRELSIVVVSRPRVVGQKDIIDQIIQIQTTYEHMTPLAFALWVSVRDQPTSIQ